MEKDINKERWTALSGAQRKSRLERVYRLIRKTAQRQLGLLDDFEKSKENIKTERHSYFFPMIKSFWEDGDFALSLGKNKFKHYAIYPARTMMEKLAKIIWFTKQKPSNQDIITKKELMRSCLISFKREYNDGRSTAEFENQYNQLNDVDLPDIKVVKISDLDAFPRHEEMCKKSGLPDASTFYDSYRDLSGVPHGNLLPTFLVQNGGKDYVYIQAMHNSVRFSIEMIKIVDFHLGHQMRQEVKDAVNLSKEITFK